MLPVAIRAFHMGVKLARVASRPSSALSVRFKDPAIESIPNSALMIGVNRRVSRPPTLRPRFRSRLAAVSTGSSGVTLVVAAVVPVKPVPIWLMSAAPSPKYQVDA